MIGVLLPCLQKEGRDYNPQGETARQVSEYALKRYGKPVTILYFGDDDAAAGRKER